ncbi:MAG: TetR/AcrR family transcriptional regulator [Deltaproteobacteria bacterium]|nr:TetR/AcrR family transcriptional regulator [Deltaproteobacteria bacterium]
MPIPNRRAAGSRIDGSYEMPKTTFGQLPDRQKKKIVRVCTRLFATHGYAHTSLKMINKDLRVADGYLYYYFDGKEDLTKWVIDRGLEIAQEHFEKHVTEKKPEGLYEFYKLAVLQGVRFIRDFPDLYGAYSQLVNEPNLPLADWLAEKIAWIDGYYREAIDREVEQGRVRSDLPPNLVVMLLDVVNTRIQEFVFRPELDPLGVASMEEDALAELVDKLIAVFRRGLRPASGA